MKGLKSSEENAVKFIELSKQYKSTPHKDTLTKSLIRSDLKEVANDLGRSLFNLLGN